MSEEDEHRECLDSQGLDGAQVGGPDLRPGIGQAGANSGSTGAVGRARESGDSSDD